MFFVAPFAHILMPFPLHDHSTGFQTVVRKRRTPSPSQTRAITPSIATLPLSTHSRGGGKRLVSSERSHNQSAHGHQAGWGAKLHRLDESSTAANSSSSSL